MNINGFALADWTIEAMLGVLVLTLLSLLVFGIRQIINGNLITRAQHQETVVEKGEWKTLALTNQETLHGQNETLGLQAETINKNAETAEAFNHLFEAIKQRAEEG